MKYIVLLSIIFLSVVLMGNKEEPATLPIPVPTPTPVTLNEDLVLEGVNDYRVLKGLNPVVEAEWLCETSSVRVNEIKLNWSHDGFDGSRFCGNYYCDMGENLARGFIDEEDLVMAWIKSPKHEEIMSIKYYKYGCVSTDNQFTVLHLSDVLL